MHKSLGLFLFLLICAGTINITLWDQNTDDAVKFKISGENLSLDGYAKMSGMYSAGYLNNVSTMDEYVLNTGHGYAVATENLTN